LAASGSRTADFTTRAVVVRETHLDAAAVVKVHGRCGEVCGPQAGSASRGWSAAFAAAGLARGPPSGALTLTHNAYAHALHYAARDAPGVRVAPCVQFLGGPAPDVPHYYMLLQGGVCSVHPPVKAGVCKATDGGWEPKGIRKEKCSRIRRCRRCNKVTAFFSQNWEDEHNRCKTCIF
jgi:hypothetical protein